MIRKFLAMSIASALAAAASGCNGAAGPSGGAEPGKVEPPAETATVESAKPSPAHAPAQGQTPAAPAASKIKAVPLPATLPKSPAAAEGLEASAPWKALNWANPAELSVVTEGGNVLMRLKAAGGKFDKVALSAVDKLSLAEKGEAAFHIYNPARKSLSIAFGVFVTQDRVYYESPAVEVGTGWKEVKFDLAASSYKCDSSKWEYKAALWKREDVRELVLLFYESGPFEAAVDGFRINLAPAPPAAPPAKVEPKPATPAPPAPTEAPDVPGERASAAPQAHGDALDAARIGKKLSDEDRARIRKALEEMEKN